MALSQDTHTALGLDQPPPAEVNGRSNQDIMPSLDHPGDAPYHPCAEAYPAEEVPAGEVVIYRNWAKTDCYAGTHRDLFVHLPAGLNRAQPVRLIVFNDGVGYLSRRGSVRATRVLDSLHAAGEVAQTVAVFINSGIPDASDHIPGEPNDEALSQRSFEYDSLTPLYGEFLRQEVLPFIANEQQLTFSEDPTERTICGISSGGICAFTVAWLHTESFQRVLSHCGSFTGIRGGHNYPYLIRTTERKPLRVLLQSGENDAGTLFGDWPLANRTMANALDYAGYDYRFEFGTGGHSLRHGGAIFADSLRWLWRTP